MGDPDSGPVVLVSERTESLASLAFSRSVCWKVGWPKVLYNMRRGFCKEGQRSLQLAQEPVGQGVFLKGQGTWVTPAGHYGSRMRPGLRRVTAAKAAGEPDAPVSYAGKLRPKEREVSLQTLRLSAQSLKDDPHIAICVLGHAIICLK